MTQDERWQFHFNEVIQYMKTYKRNPSRHRIEDHKMFNWIKANKKLYRREELPQDRMKQFKQLLAFSIQYRHLNQYE